MSKLEELIQKYCPDGVEYHKIKEVYKRIKGTPITAGKMKEIATPNGSVRIFAGGKTVIDANEEDIPNANITKVPAVLVQSRGVIDAVYYDKPFTFKNEMWAYTTSNQQSVKYLYYVLKSNIQTFRDAASGMGSLPQISLGVTEDFEIPVPPLPVQEEIVRVLDTFTELQAELQAKLQTELQKRIQQYNFYRDKLLSFDGRNDVVWKKLEDACEIKRGIRVVKQQLKDNGEYPVFQNSIAPMGYYDQHNRLGGMSYIICAGSSSGSVGYCSTPFWAADDCFTIGGDKMNNRYVFHFLKKDNYRLFNQVRNGSMPRLPHTAIDNLIIPIPPLEEQEKIASILDRYDALTNNLTAGLPVEIEKRRQQYEYYRDNLLTFKRKEA